MDEKRVLQVFKDSQPKSYNKEYEKSRSKETNKEKEKERRGSQEPISKQDLLKYCAAARPRVRKANFSLSNEQSSSFAKTANNYTQINPTKTFSKNFPELKLDFQNYRFKPKNPLLQLQKSENKGKMVNSSRLKQFNIYKEVSEPRSNLPSSLYESIFRKGQEKKVTVGFRVQKLSMPSKGGRQTDLVRNNTFATPDK